MIDLRAYDVTYNHPGEKSLAQHVIELRIKDKDFESLLNALRERVDPIMGGTTIARLAQSILSATEGWSPNELSSGTR